MRTVPVGIVCASFSGKIPANNHAPVIAAIQKSGVIRIDSGIKDGDPDTGTV